MSIELPGFLYRTIRTGERYLTLLGQFASFLIFAAVCLAITGVVVWAKPPGNPDLGLPMLATSAGLFLAGIIARILLAALACLFSIEWHLRRWTQER